MVRHQLIACSLIPKKQRGSRSYTGTQSEEQCFALQNNDRGSRDPHRRAVMVCGVISTVARQRTYSHGFLRGVHWISAVQSLMHSLEYLNDPRVIHVPLALIENLQRLLVGQPASIRSI